MNLYWEDLEDKYIPEKGELFEFSAKDKEEVDGWVEYCKTSEQKRSTNGG